MEEPTDRRKKKKEMKVPFTKSVREQAANIIGCKPGSLQFFPSAYDPLNPCNKINATICKQEGSNYGSMVISMVNDQVLSDPVCVYGTPTIQKMPMAKTYHQTYYLANKWNGENITFFKYHDIEGNVFVSARPRIYPFLRDIRSFTYLSFIKNLLGLEPNSNRQTTNEEPKEGFKDNPNEEPKEGFKDKPNEETKEVPIEEIKQVQKEEIKQEPIEKIKQEPKEKLKEESKEGDMNIDNSTQKKMIDITSLPPLLLLLNNDNIQSITFELCGNQIPGLVSYDFPLSLKPLFYTETDGNISPIMTSSTNHQPPEKNAEFKENVNYVSRDIGPMEFNPVEIFAILKDFKKNALSLNEHYRMQNNLMCGYYFNHFVIEGKVLYCMNENLKLTNRNSMYKIKPSDIEESHSVVFDSVMQCKVIEGLSKLYSRVEPITEETLRQEMDMSIVSWDRFGNDIMDLIKGIPNVYAEATDSVQKVLIMVGIPGSGKSTAAQKLIAMNDGWTRVNQDELKTRGACEKCAREYLKKGYSLIVDRCNFDIKQRNTWIKIASEFGVNDVRCLYFNIDPKICKERVTIREDHPTIPKGDTGPKIIDTFLSQLLPPIIVEGFSEVTTITNDKELDDALIKLAQSVELSPVCIKESPGKKKKLNPTTPPKEEEDRPEKELGVFNPFEALENLN